MLKIGKKNNSKLLKEKHRGSASLQLQSFSLCYMSNWTPMRASWLTATQWVYWACSNNWFVPPFLCTFHRDWVFEMSKPKNTLICPTLKDLERICNQTNFWFLILTHFELNFPSTKNDILWLDIESPSKLFLPLSVSIILPWSTSVLKSWKKKNDCF